jgi:hypothetical protein
MRLVFDSDGAYESFQFIFIGLMNCRLPAGTPERALLMSGLVAKLAAVSRVDGGGRVLKTECEIELTQDEQILALDAMANTSWRSEVFPQVRRACEFLGASFEEQSRRTV